MSAKQTNRTYRFSSFQELLDVVPADRIELCMTELGKVYAAAKLAHDEMSSKTKLKTRLEIQMPQEWIDDGKGELQATVIDSINSEHITIANIR